MRYVTSPVSALLIALATISSAAAMGSGGTSGPNAPYGKNINGTSGIQPSELIDVSAGPQDSNSNLATLMQTFKQPEQPRH
jgi:hypothetical protein